MSGMTVPERPCQRCGASAASGARFCPSCGLAISRLAAGQVLDGKYEVLDKIGEGGMAEVYRARHLHLDEIRIIKVTKPDALGESGEPRRFQEEARLATLVRHPNVAALYDFSRQPDGSFYMVWEFIDGVTLEAWLRRHGPLPPARALEVAEQVLAGLGEIHAQGIVHRDLSPDNIMVREGPGGGLRAKIIDLGIAKRVAAESLQMTGTGLFLGKLKYCSPEQAGSLPPGAALDARSDLYSFGAVLYEMLAGKAPFESSTPEGYIGKHLHAPAPPLDVSRLPRGLGAPLAAVVGRALEKRRERRFRDAREFAEAISRLRPLAIEVAAGAAAALQPARRRSAAAWIAAAVLLASLAAGFYALRRREPPKRAAASVPAAPARGAAPAATAPPGPLLVPSPVPAAPSSGEAVAPGAPPAPPAAAPTAAAPLPAPAPAAPRAAEGLPGPAEARRLLALWKARPNEARARRAVEIAKMANRFVEAYPDDPLTAEIRTGLPELLKTRAAAALDDAQPLVAALYFRAYRDLSFAPGDPELERRMERLGSSAGGRAPRRGKPVPASPASP